MDRPLTDRSVLRQRAHLTKHVARWARWNYTLLLTSNTAGKLGFGRKEVTSNLEPRPEQHIEPAFAAELRRAAGL